MINKTDRIEFKKINLIGINMDDVFLVRIEAWYLFSIPIYKRETIVFSRDGGYKHYLWKSRDE
jgi:hypothetical protein